MTKKITAYIVLETQDKNPQSKPKSRGWQPGHFYEASGPCPREVVFGPNPRELVHGEVGPNMVK